MRLCLPAWRKRMVLKVPCRSASNPLPPIRHKLIGDAGVRQFQHETVFENPKWESQLMADQEAMQSYAAGKPVPTVDPDDIRRFREVGKLVVRDKPAEGCVGIDIRLFA